MLSIKEGKGRGVEDTGVAVIGVGWREEEGWIFTGFIYPRMSHGGSSGRCELLEVKEG